MLSLFVSMPFCQILKTLTELYIFTYYNGTEVALALRADRFEMKQEFLGFKFYLFD